MPEIIDVAQMSDSEIIAEIDANQKRVLLLFKEAASRVKKLTTGESFMRDENANVAEYWYQVGLNHPELIAQICNMSDFATKIAYFKSLIAVATQDAQIGAILKAPRDAASKDCSWYVSYIRNQVVSQKNNPVYKLILQKEPNPRQSSAKAQPASGAQSVEKE